MTAPTAKQIVHHRRLRRAARSESRRNEGTLPCRLADHFSHASGRRVIRKFATETAMRSAPKTMS